MHMADALLSPAVAVTMYAASAAAAGVSLVQLRREELATPETAKKKLPTMAVMSALVFAGQMINYTIPGTGSSGHLCGGMLLSAMLGPWAGFLSMIVILAMWLLPPAPFCSLLTEGCLRWARMSGTWRSTAASWDISLSTGP